MNKTRNKQTQTRGRNPRLRRDADPYAFEPNPWNRATLEMRKEIGTSSAITFQQMAAALRSQLFPAGSAAQLVFKVLAIHAWNISGGALQLVINDPVAAVDGKLTELITLRDLPARNKWANLHFSMPRRCIIPVDPAAAGTSADFVSFATDNPAEPESGILYVEVMYRSASNAEVPPIPPPAI